MQMECHIQSIFMSLRQVKQGVRTAMLDCTRNYDTDGNALVLTGAAGNDYDKGNSNERVFRVGHGSR